MVISDIPRCAKDGGSTEARADAAGPFMAVVFCSSNRAPGGPDKEGRKVKRPSVLTLNSRRRGKRIGSSGISSPRNRTLVSFTTPTPVLFCRTRKNVSVGTSVRPSDMFVSVVIERKWLVRGVEYRERIFKDPRCETLRAAFSSGAVDIDKTRPPSWI
jgi:hypothetical protein